MGMHFRSTSIRRFVSVFVLTAALSGLGIVPARADHAPVPVLTAPTNGAEFCVPQGAGSVTVPVAGTLSEQTDAIRLFVDDVQSEENTPGETSWSFAPNLPAGTYGLDATSMVVADDDTEHESEHTPTVTVTVKDPPIGIDPITRTSGAISPKNADGYKDSVTFTARRSASGMVRFIVRAPSTAIVRMTSWQSGSSGTQRSFVWNGRDGSGNLVGDASYNVTAEWKATSSGCVRTRTSSVRVDNLAPYAARSVNPSTFYPAENDAFIEYKDTEQITLGSLNEEAKPTLQIRRAGKTVKTQTFGWKTRSTTVNWNGRNGSGKMYPEGTYVAKWRIIDRVHNVKIYKMSFSLSHKHLVKRVTTLTKRGDAFRSRAVSGCGDVSTWLSNWSEGVWLDVPDCYYDDSYYGPDAATTEYRFSTPSAPYHHSVRLQAYGYSLDGDHLFGFLYAGSDPRVVGSVGGTRGAWRTFGSKPAGRINTGGRVRALMFLYSPCDCWDVEYDIRSVRVVVTDAVLRY